MKSVAPLGAGRPARDDLAWLDAAADLWGQERAEIGFTARVFAQTSLPYRDPGDVVEWTRTNGNLSVILKPGPSVRLEDGTRRPLGLPFGTKPRLLLAWMTTEALRTKSRTISMGGSMSGLCRELGLPVTGLEIRRIKDQSMRLFKAYMAIEYIEQVGELRGEMGRAFTVASAWDVWTSNGATPADDASDTMPFTVTLSAELYDELVSYPVPLDLGALRLLRASPLRLDVYTWLTYRMSYLRRPVVVSWEQLFSQFGSTATSERGVRKFRQDFATALRHVLAIYPDAKVDEVPAGLRLRPSPTHVSRGARPSLTAR